MRLLILTALALAALAPCASAQQALKLVDSIFIHSNAPFNEDRPINRVFGFGGEYTDSIDYRLPSDRREREIPAMPPSSLFVLFDAQNVTAWIDRDIRGVPDSVRAGTATKFSLRYVFDIQRGSGPMITFVMPRALPRGIDSINFRDVIGGTGGVIFNETITSGPDSVTIPNDALTRIAMIVYYDANNVSTSVEEPRASRVAGLRLVPNPAAGRVAVDGDLPAGSRLVLTDVRGDAWLETRVSGDPDRQTLALDGLAAGLYFVRAVSPQGTIIAESRLLVRD